jgi:hypothetical protein
MSRSIAKIIEDSISRRAFLVKVTTMTSAFIGGLFGMPNIAYACHCCGMCRNPQQCTWNEALCSCVWCWTCEVRADCKVYWCKECLIAPLQNGCFPAACECHRKYVNDQCRYCAQDDAVVLCSRVETYATSIPGCVRQ